MIFRFCCNNLSDHVYLFLVVLMILKVGRNNLSGHIYVFHVVMTCYTSICQHKTTRPCKHYRNIRGGGVIDASVVSPYRDVSTFRCTGEVGCMNY